MERTQKNKIANKYRKTIYFGKDLYEQLNEMSKFLGLPFSTTIRIILETGLSFANAIERSGNNETTGK